MRFSDITFFMPVQICVLDSCGYVFFEGYSCDIPDPLFFHLEVYPVKAISYGINGLNIILNGNLEKEE